MKSRFSLLLSLLFVASIGFAQNNMVIYGFVFNGSTPAPQPVEGQEVIINLDSTNTGYTFQDTVLTDNQGFYTATIFAPGEVTFGLITLSTFDSCQASYESSIVPYFPGLPGIILEFTVCNTYVPLCEAFYDYSPSGTNINTIFFVDYSTGNPTNWEWTYDDIVFSTEQYPTFTFPDEGFYTVCLTITDSTNNCTDTYCADITVGSPGFSGCENIFYYYSTGAQNTLTFEGYLLNQPPALSFEWDFGDGTTGTGQTVTHTFPADSNQSFVVCLTTTSILPGGDTCEYVSCQDVLLYYPVDCEAFFFYFQQNDPALTVQFQDWSFTPSSSPDSWSWDFGDGSTSTLQNTVHTYADTGYYQVCLTITDSLNNCTDTYCETIFVEPTAPPLPCYNVITIDTLDPETYTATFTGEAFQNGFPVNSNTEYEWDFGDGTAGTGQTVTHTFPADSLDFFLVCLTTTTVTPGTSDTCVFTGCTIVFFDPFPGPGCESYFAYTEDSGLVINFESYTYSQYPGTFDWEFGDGTTGTGQSVTHQYDEGGVYQVTLTSVDAAGCVWTTTQLIFVGSNNTFNIFGIVYLDSNLVADQGIVRLMTTDSLWQNPIVLDSTTIEGDGSYVFEDVSLDDPFMLYFTQAELSEQSAYFGQYVPTYHLNSMTWEYAFPILPIFSWPADIFLIPAAGNDGGPGNISGNVTSLNVRESLSGVQVILMNGDMEPLAYTTTDENGNFEFENLALGTYVVHAEMMGVHSTQATITLNEDDMESEVVFVVDGNQATLSITEKSNPNFSGIGEIYPNPVNNQAWIELGVEKSIEVRFSVYNQVGQVVYEDIQFLQSGNNRVNVNTSSLKTGFYLLNITSEEGDFVSKKLLKR